MDSYRILIVGARCGQHFEAIRHALQSMDGDIVYLGIPANPGIIIYSEKEKDMKLPFLAALVAAALSELSVRQITMTPCMEDIRVLVLPGTTPDYRIKSGYRHDRRSKRALVTLHSLRRKLIPRGIHRDAHGRPVKQKLMLARLTKRNGSR